MNDDTLTAARFSNIPDRIRRGEVTARQVLRTAAEQLEAHEEQLNAVAAPLPDLAEQSADRVDQAVAEDRDPGPLAGVPFTVKECYHIAGTPHSLGRVRQTAVARDTAPLIERLLAAGAVPVAKTNLSQLMLLYETDNPRYGRTNHPERPDRSPGGSGGGDAAALAAGYGCFGMGTDLGGSIRLPAHACGLVGLLPTRGRLCGEGIEPVIPGLAGLEIQPAAMARSVTEVGAVMQVLCQAAPPGRPAAPAWSACRRDPASLRVGVWETENYLPACPTAQRAVRRAADSLARAGVDVVPMMPPDLRTATHLYCALFGADGGKSIRQRLSGEHIDSRIRPLMRLGRLPRWIRSALGALLQWRGETYLAGILRHSFRCSASTLWETLEEVRRYGAEFLERLRSLQLDAVLLPPHATVAFEHGRSLHMLPAAGYAMLANLIGAPAGVVPVTRVAEDEQAGPAAGHSRCEQAAAANLVGAAGLPCGVQVLAAPWNDPLALEVMRIIEADVGWQRGPDPFATQPDAADIAG